jgi:photosystem II stability/assembly factor-like uncharacterized protein
MKKFYFLFVALIIMNESMAQWIPQNSGITNELIDVFFASADTGYAVSSELGGLILKTTDGGINWTILAEMDSLSFNSVYFTSIDIGYVAGGLVNYEDNPGIVLKTTNGGESWETIFTYTDTNVNGTELASLRFLDENTGYALGFSWCSTGSCGAYFLKTIDAGVNWTFDNLPAEWISDVYFINSDTGFVVGKDLTYGWLVLKTTNGGQNWTAINSGVFWDPSWLSSVYFPNETTGYAVGADYNDEGTESLILKTTNGGENWTKLVTEIDPYLKNVYFYNDDIGYVLSSQSIYKTINGGMDWEEQLLGGPYEWLNSFYFLNPDTGFIVGNNGKILKTTNGGGYVGIIDLNQATNTLTIYPNPSSDKITIETSTEGHLSILNLKGQELLNQYISRPSTQIDITYMPSGVYIIRFTNEKTVQVLKIIRK